MPESMPTASDGGKDPAATVYRLYAADGTLLYVGVAAEALERIGAHRRERPWWPMVTRIELARFPTRRAALTSETTAIRTERPLFNVAQRYVVEGQPQHMPRTVCACGEEVAVTATGKLRRHWGGGRFCRFSGTLVAEFQRPGVA